MTLQGNHRLFPSAGIAEQDEPKRFIRIKKTVEVLEGDKIARLEPYEGFKVEFTIQFDHPLFTQTNQIASIEFSTTSFIREISRARTFGFLKDYKMIKEQNLALGGSLHNVILVDDQKVVNEEGLRHENEFVHHKILDAIGDLYLLGAPLLGKFSGKKSGHRLNNILLRKLMEEPDSWEYVTFKEAKEVPISYLKANGDQESAAA